MPEFRVLVNVQIGEGVEAANLAAALYATAPGLGDQAHGLKLVERLGERCRMMSSPRASGRLRAALTLPLLPLRSLARRSA
jgi:hypothetical protein